MKLLATTNRYYLALVTTLFVLGTVALYYGLQRAFAREVDEQLGLQRTYLTQRIERARALPPIVTPTELSISPTPRPEGFGDTMLLDSAEHTLVPFRQVTFRVRMQDRPYWLTARKSLLETADVLTVVLTVMLPVMGLLFVGVVLLNRWLSRWLWAPFQHTLAALRGYQLQQPQALALPPTRIAEFSELNQAVTQLTERVAADYRALQEFTENAAHETQTPLAIMQAQLEQLMQLPALPPAAARPVQELYRGTLRLSRLHQALTLLSKIENRQFADARPVPLAELLAEKLRQLQDFAEAKQLQPTLTIEAPRTVAMHPALAESLVSNLLQNAIKHNRRGGRLQVRLSADALEVANTGPALSGDPMQLLGRFRKQNAASESPGLGLSIAQQICARYGYRLHYSYQEDGHLHIVRVHF